MVMRIGGMASGLDTEQIVRDLMRAERMKIDKYFRQEEALKWRREALNTTNKTLADFILKARSGFGLTRTTSTGAILKSSIQSFDWVKKVSSSDDSIIKATASATAMEGIYTVKANQLAEVASVTSENLKDILTNSKFTEESSFDITTKYGTATINIEGASVTGKQVNKLNFKNTGEGEEQVVNELTLHINGKKIVLDEDFDSVEDLKNHLEGLVDGQGNPLLSGITIGVGENNNLVFTSNDNIVIDSSDPELEDKLGLKNGLYKANNSISDVVNQINNATVRVDGKDVSLGIRAAYDPNLGKLMITTKAQGSNEEISISGGITEQIFGSATVNKTGQNAEIEFNGDKIEQSSNNFTMFGVNYSLQAEGTITVNVESNVDGIFDKVKEFVDDYNGLLDNLNGLLNQKSYKDFQPLTKEEKEAMKEKEIELWEEKAKSGLLRNDETISRTLQTIRSGLYMEVMDGENPLQGFKHITQIGITTGNYQSGGKLEINEEKLRQAIIENPEGVMNLLFKTSDIKVPSGNTAEASAVAANKRANSGLVERLFDDMIVGMKDIVRRAGTGEDANTFRNVQSNMLIDFVTSGSISVMDRDIMNIGKRIAREEMILMGREERYWRQFTAMEKALEKMNQQSGWLMSQLGQMGS